MGAEWGEYLPTQLPKSSTGWHLIWLNNQAMAFEVINSGDKFVLVNLNNGGRYELDNNTHYWCALNAAPPEPVKLGSHLGAAFGGNTATNKPEPRKIGIDAMRKSKSAKNAPQAQQPLFGDDTTPDNNALGINNSIGRS